MSRDDCIRVVYQSPEIQRNMTVILWPAVLVIFAQLLCPVLRHIFKHCGIDTIGPSPKDPQVSNCKHAIVAVDLAIWQVGQRFYQLQLRPLQPMKQRTSSTIISFAGTRSLRINSIRQRASICKWVIKNLVEIPKIRHHFSTPYPTILLAYERCQLLFPSASNHSLTKKLPYKIRKEVSKEFHSRFVLSKY
jgi:hypothetical protein